jgi:hypothetical protein
VSWNNWVFHEALGEELRDWRTFSIPDPANAPGIHALLDATWKVGERIQSVSKEYEALATTRRRGNPGTIGAHARLRYLVMPIDDSTTWVPSSGKTRI